MLLNSHFSFFLFNRLLNLCLNVNVVPASTGALTSSKRSWSLVFKTMGKMLPVWKRLTSWSWQCDTWPSSNNNTTKWSVLNKTWVRMRSTGLVSLTVPKRSPGFWPPHQKLMSSWVPLSWSILAIHSTAWAALPHLVPALQWWPDQAPPAAMQVTKAGTTGLTLHLPHQQSHNSHKCLLFPLPSAVESPAQVENVSGDRGKYFYYTHQHSII